MITVIFLILLVVAIVNGKQMDKKYINMMTEIYKAGAESTKETKRSAGSSPYGRN